MLIGYSRTSTADQIAGLEAQQTALAATGCTKVFSEQASSVGQRGQLDAVLDYVREGDTLVLIRLDRLARSTADCWGSWCSWSASRWGCASWTSGGRGGHTLAHGSDAADHVRGGGRVRAGDHAGAAAAKEQAGDLTGMRRRWCRHCRRSSRRRTNGKETSDEQLWRRPDRSDGRGGCARPGQGRGGASAHGRGARCARDPRGDGSVAAGIRQRLTLGHRPSAARSPRRSRRLTLSFVLVGERGIEQGAVMGTRRRQHGAHLDSFGAPYPDRPEAMSIPQRSTYDAGGIRTK